MKTLITFGQDHVHHISDKVFDKDCVAVINNVTAEEGRAKAFEIFGQYFCFEYHDSYKKQPDLSCFPRGCINVEQEETFRVVAWHTVGGVYYTQAPNREEARKIVERELNNSGKQPDEITHREFEVVEVLE